jgi:phage terminase large subunit GpA-like protein
MLRRAFVPAPDLLPSQWAEQRRVLPSETGDAPGRWRNSITPYLVEIMDAAADPAYQEIAVMGASQVGKTEVELNLVGWSVDLRPSPIVIVLPTENAAETWSRDRLDRLIAHTPTVREKVSTRKSRDSANTTFRKEYTGGTISLGWASSAVELAQRPASLLIVDEEDRMKGDVGGEGDPVEILRARSRTFVDRTMIRVSSPGRAGISRIEPAFERGDQRRWFVRCLERKCGHAQTVEFKHFTWDERRPQTVRFACERCGALIDEAAKIELVRGGRWIAAQPGRRIASFHVPAWISLLISWEDLVHEWLEAQGNPLKLQAVVNTIFAESYEEEGSRVDSVTLTERLEAFSDPELPVAPTHAGLLTAAADVQADRIEVDVVGWGDGEESWLNWHVELLGDPGRLGAGPLEKQDDAAAWVWKRLRDVLLRPYPHASGSTLTIQAAMIDSGYQAESVYRFVRPLQGRRIWASKGRGEDGFPLAVRPQAPRKDGILLWSIGTLAAKDLLFSRLRLAEAGPGYVHLPTWISHDYLLELTAERVRRRWRRGKLRRIYEPIRARNEALDLWVGNLAALHALGPAVTQQLGRFAEALTGQPAAERPPSRPPGRRGGGFIGGWNR